MEDKTFIIAMDLGGTKLRIALADSQSNIIDRFSAPTHPEEGKEDILKRVSKEIRRLVSGVGWDSIKGVGMAVPGPVDPVSGVLLTPPNLPGWRNVPLKALCEKELKVPVYVGNDANLAALGEGRFGVGKGVSDFIYVTVGTGIGGGIISKGELLLGVGGLAGEVGHMTIEVKGPQCKCGNIGCWETLASGTAVSRIAQTRLSQGEVSAMAQMTDGDLRKVTGEIIIAAARAGDDLAQDILRTAGIYLGVGIVNLLHILNPSLVIIGGGFALAAGDLVLQPAREVVSERAMPNFRVPVVPAALGDDAGLKGAVALVLATRQSA